MTPILDIKNLTVGFETPAGKLKVVDDISLACSRGETVAVLGESGSGKSVLAGAIMSILDASARIRGRILLNGQDILILNEWEMEKIRGNRMAIIVQNPDSALNPVLPVGSQLAEGLRTHTRTNKKKARKMVLEALNAMDFTECESLLNMYPHQLSGGMKQRLLISAALLTRPEMVIADEPTQGLDRSTKEVIMAEMKKPCREHQYGLLLITHDTQVAREMGNRVAVMYAGEIVEIADSRRFFQNPSHPYSRCLLDASPEKGFRPISGISPSTDHLPSGCRFHPRCPRRIGPCDSTNPEMKEVNGDKVKCHLY